MTSFTVTTNGSRIIMIYSPFAPSLVLSHLKFRMDILCIELCRLSAATYWDMTSQQSKFFYTLKMQ